VRSRGPAASPSEGTSRGRLGATAAAGAGVADAGARDSRRARPGRKSPVAAWWTARPDAPAELLSDAMRVPIGGGSDAVTIATRAATATPPITTNAAARELFVPPDVSTVHCRGPITRLAATGHRRPADLVGGTKTPTDPVVRETHELDVSTVFPSIPAPPLGWGRLYRWIHMLCFLQHGRCGR